MPDIKYKNKNFNFAYRVSAIIYNKDKSKILLFYGNNSDFYMLPGGKVKELEKFKAIESDWINFIWININEIDNYKIHPIQIKQFLNSKNNHIIEKNYKYM